jgi:hypothetical protein
MEVGLSVRTFREGSWFFAECPELKLIDQGKTRKEAIHYLRQMVIASLIEAIESGNIEAMLTTLGFKQTKYRGKPIEYYDMQGEKYKNYLPLTFDATISPRVEMANNRELASI